MWQVFRERLSILVVVLICAGVHAQQRREYLQTAIVTETNGVVTVAANDPRPLAQALCAIARRHEWLVDYEDPPYGAHDLFDVTDSVWRAKNPKARSAFIPAGGAFTFEYLGASSATEEMILQKMVAAYNRSGNPGKFEVRDEGTDSRPWSKSRKRYAIVGLSIRGEKGKVKRVAPILDTVISLSTEDRNAHQTVALIAKEISDRTGIKCSAELTQTTP